MKKTVLFLILVFMISVILTGCDRSETFDPIDWLSPMVSFSAKENTVHVWSGQYDLHRNGTFEYVFRLDGVEVPITSQALLSGGAIPAIVELSYGGEGEYLTRIVAFAYEFFDHGRPERITAHAASPNPQEILVLWQNPENNQWFNLIQDSIGRTAATLGEHNDGLVSLVRGTPQYTFKLNSETINNISELELFIIATARPTREVEYERSGYSLTFAIETPDIDHHFHSWEILVSSGLMIIVE